MQKMECLYTQSCPLYTRNIEDLRINFENQVEGS
jgi:hypothetical protein